MTTALCPGSFDPPTNGHIDVIQRCKQIFDRVVVAVVDNPSKQSMFSAEERQGMLEEVFGTSVEIESFDGLLVDFARRRNVDVVVKGLRAVSDFDYELQMAQMNRTMAGVETVFLPTNPEWSYLSSSLVREVARLGGAYQGLVPDHVATALEERLA
ncbi:MAG TPA: pantetheine-phosphate adenylyltransferase [Acidimicrobiia bacterium]|nr:pantetheine-phosphate adenylyltransferase [Acidimicrobiia bacterium]